MSFLNPILLAGLAAVSIPIIIHLLNRRKFQKVVWAAMRFLRMSVEQNQRRMKIEDIILLALRCLLLALLAVALARPAILSNASDRFGQSKVTAIIILDNSYSMGVSDGVSTRFDKARQAAEQALDSMPAGSAAAVWLASDIVQEVIPLPTFDLNLARKSIRQARLSDRATDLFPALEKAVDYLKGRMVIRKEIFLITDGQAVGWRQLGEAQNTLEKSRTEIKTHLFLVNEHEEGNLGVSELRLAGGLCPVNQPLRFEVRVTNYGKEEARETRASLSVDAEPPCDEFTIDSIAPGSSKTVSLFAKLRTEGFHSVVARIPADRLPADDSRALAVRAIKEVRALLVDGDPGAEPRESATYFLRNALAPVPPEAAPNYFIKATTISAAELAQVRLDDYDAVILADVAEFSENALQHVEQFLRRGGGLMVFPGGKVNAAFYNEQLLRRHALLPASLGAPRGQADQDEKFFSLQDKNYQHPIVSIWNDPGAGTLSSVRFYRAFKLEPAEGTEHKAQPVKGDHKSPRSSPFRAAGQDAGDPQVVLSFTDGSPAVMERAWGLGRVILFSSTANSAWNDWPVRLSFVPLIHRALGALVQRQDEGLNILVGEKFNRRLSAELLDKDATIVKPGQKDVLRDLRHIELVNGWPTVQYDTTDQGGVYDVSVAEPPMALKFAAQPPAYESSMDELSPAQITVLKSVANVISWTPNLSLKGLLEKDRTGLEFWWPLVIAGLVVAGAETFFGQWFSRAK
jgi:hypothetical protein